MTASLSPPMFLQFFNPNNTGAPAAGYKLFTYIAGTSTKQATWTDSTQTVQNANPIILDSNGAAYVWLNSGLFYKYVFAPPNDTDPPTSAIRTVDNISSNILYGQTAAESAAGVTPSSYAYPPGDVRRYGAVGDGVTNDTTPLVNALKVQQSVFIPGGFNCAVTSQLNLLANQTIYGVGFQSQITCTGVGISAINIAATNTSVHDLFVKYVGTSTSGENGAAVAILTGASFTTITRCRFEGGLSGVTVSGASDNVIDDNIITAISLSAQDDTSWDIGVYIGGGSRNRITRNKCYGGSYCGILVESGGSAPAAIDRTIIAENHIGPHNAYGTIVYNGGGGCTRNTIANNEIWDIQGSAHSSGNRPFGMGIYVQSAEWTTISGNVIENTNILTDVQTLAPGAIGVNSVSCFTVTGNVIKIPQWYGIYCVNDGNNLGGAAIQGNIITSPVKAGIFVNGTSQVTVIGNTVTGGSGDGLTYSFGAGTGVGISFIGNKVKDCTAGTGINLANLQCPNVSHNYVLGCLNGMQFNNVTGGIINGNEIRNCTSNDVFLDNTNSGYIHFDRNTVRSAATNGINDGFGLTYGINDVAGQTSPYTGSVGYERVLATSATPSVGGTLSAQYGGATAITDLLNGYPGQRVTIRATGSVTFNNNAGSAATKLINRAGANLSLTSGQTVTYELVPGGPWYQVN